MHASSENPALGALQVRSARAGETGVMENRLYKWILDACMKKEETEARSAEGLSAKPPEA